MGCLDYRRRVQELRPGYRCVSIPLGDAQRLVEFEGLLASTVLAGPLFALVQSASTGGPKIDVDPYQLEEARRDGNGVASAGASSRTARVGQVKPTEWCSGHRDDGGLGPFSESGQWPSAPQ